MSYIPKYDLTSRIEHSKYDAGLGMHKGMRLKQVEDPKTTDFKQVLSGVIENLNNETNAPDKLLKDVMSGKDNVDIHDVMAAIAKSEIAVNVVTTMTGKVVNAYDRIMQISV